MAEPARKKILVVDDEEYLVKLLKSRLLINRFEVVTASTGREAIEQALEEHPDLIIIDVMLPDMGGAQTVTEMRKNEMLAGIPVIAISAEHGAREKFRASDITAFVTKPFQPDELISTVKQAIQKSFPRSPNSST